MLSPPTQDERVGKLATPLGKDKLCLVRFEGHEAIGELFEFNVEAVSADPNIDFSSILGQTCSVRLETTDSVGRDFSGVLTEARWIGTRYDLHVYRLVLRPWPWLLTLRAQCRIFPKMSPKKIIKEALGDGAFGPIEDDMHEDYPEPEYTVQYRETDLNFALRLMEKYGIYFYFDFDKGDGTSPSGHKMVLADASSFQDLPAPGEILYAPPGVGERRDMQTFVDWTKMQAMAPGVFELNDYDYTKPPTDLVGRKEAGYVYDKSSYVYDYAAGHDQKGDGETLARVRMEADRRGERSFANGYAPSLTPGYKIKRTSTDNDPHDGSYLIRHATHWYGDQRYDSRESGSGASYSGRYEVSNASIPYRMPLRSRRPVIIGTQSALVIRGAKSAGAEIDVDSLGRILVQFYWDRKKTPSRRVRVAQVWAGKNRGALFTPRVGDEVLIAYEDGDPDRPIVVGSVYNGANTVPMTLPAKQVRSGILTLSSTGGGGYNMLLFDDTAGAESVKLRTQKDLKFKALHDQEIDIGNDRKDKVGADLKQKVGANHTIDVGTKYALTAGQEIVLKVANSTITINAQGITLEAPTITLKADATVSVAAPQTSITA